MTDYNDGNNHGWNGGDCPVHPKTEVQYWLRYGGSDTCKADRRMWTHLGGGSDIIAFRVTKVHVEPKVYWVVQMSHGISYTAMDEADAWRVAGVDPENRTVEKYQQVPL